MIQDRRIMIREFANKDGITIGHVYFIMKEDLGFRRISAKIAPRLLMIEQKQLHLEFVQDMLATASDLQ